VTMLAFEPLNGLPVSGDKRPRKITRCLWKGNAEYYFSGLMDELRISDKDSAGVSGGGKDYLNPG